MAEDTDTIASIERVQNFDLESLRRAELGPFALGDATPAARRTIDLYREVPVQFVAELPVQLQATLRKNADAAFSVFTEVLNFDPEAVENPSQVKTQLLNKVEGLRDPQFQQVYPIISYLATRQHDFGALESQARAAAQAARDEADRLRETLENAEAEAGMHLRAPG
jgi:hypothetical protein